MGALEQNRLLDWCSLAMVGGPQVTENQQCIDENYQPIEGLYAAGNSSCGLYGPNYAMEVMTGMGRSYAAISGYVASKHALGVLERL
jgi:fumarate reductase flavoprotein subunit